MELENNRVNIGYLTDDLNEARGLQSALRGSVKKDLRDLVFVLPTGDRSKLIELISKYKFDIVLVSESVIGFEAIDFATTVSNAHKGIHGVRVPTFLVTKREPKPYEVSALLQKGYTDVLVSPMDLPIVLQKIQYAMVDREILEEKQVYSHRANNVVANVALPQRLFSISETEAVIVSTKEYPAGTVTSLYTDAFLLASDSGEVVSRVVSCEKIGEVEGASVFKTTFSFQAITPSLSKSIRKWIQTQSASENEVRLASAS